jgi:hypothetical protein
MLPSILTYWPVLVQFVGAAGLTAVLVRLGVHERFATRMLRYRRWLGGLGLAWFAAGAFRMSQLQPGTTRFDPLVRLTTDGMVAFVSLYLWAIWFAPREPEVWTWTGKQVPLRGANRYAGVFLLTLLAMGIAMGLVQDVLGAIGFA